MPCLLQVALGEDCPGVEHLRVQAEQADPRAFGHRIENGIDVGAMRAPHGGVDPREHGHHEIGG